MKRYNPTEIEPKWQQIWASDERYKAPDYSDKPKYYVTGMFPYPSGAGMHIGHFLEHSIVDAVARFRRSLGHNVMYPMGFDNFGLPAENYAIKTGVSPQKATADNMANFKTQLNRVGASIDWSREVRTSDPEYYKWTQWIFTKLFERGLAYQKESMQWWCTIDKTVLANEQVINGKSWRHDGPDDPLVVKKPMKQWFFKITEYADELLEELDDLDWPEKIKTAQRNWIGKSVGAEVEFVVADPTIELSETASSRRESESSSSREAAELTSFKQSSLRQDNASSASRVPADVSNSSSADADTLHITAFTTRPDTIFGATFIVLAPEHPLARSLATDDMRESVEDYIDEAIKKTEIERQSEGKEKTGVWTGSYAINPASGEKVPIWIADYVLGGYGTGAVMAVPAHDERDFSFAETYDLPIVEVIEKSDDVVVYNGEGALMNSGRFDGMASSEAREEIVAWLEQQGMGRAKTTYKMRDWLISRQRYWGAPIPIAYDKNGDAHVIPEDQLPVVLPKVEDFQPDGSGKSVLARDDDFMNVTINGEEMTRETDTLDGYACSSWYLLRYADPRNTEQAWDPAKVAYWNPVDMYIGGDHAVAHLLYVRFWNHVFYDMGLVSSKEPVKKLVYHGLIQAEDGTKMSKSKGNVVDPLEVIDAGYGADALRTFELFLGPINENSAWNSRGIAGVYRFLNRFWTLVQECIDAELTTNDDTDAKLASVTHQTIKKVTDDINRLSFNTAIATLMECVNQLYKLKLDGFTPSWKDNLEKLIQLLQPVAPHMSAELWQQLGHDSQLDFESWPEWDSQKIISDTMTIAVQVNGKLRATIEVSADAEKPDIEAAALADSNVAAHIGDKKPAKVIYVPGRLVSIVVK